MLCLSKDKTAMSTGSMEMTMLEEADLEFNKFLSDIHRNMFKTLEENEILQEEVISLRKENKVLRNLLVESKAVLEKKRDLEERMNALEARINETKRNKLSGLKLMLTGLRA